MFGCDTAKRHFESFLIVSPEPLDSYIPKKEVMLMGIALSRVDEKGDLLESIE